MLQRHVVIFDLSVEFEIKKKFRDDEGFICCAKVRSITKPHLTLLTDWMPVWVR